MTTENKIQKAANKKANQLAKEFGLNQTGFEKVWKSVSFLYPTADTHIALDYAANLEAKRS